MMPSGRSETRSREREPLEADGSEFTKVFKGISGSRIVLSEVHPSVCRSHYPADDAVEEKREVEVGGGAEEICLILRGTVIFGAGSCAFRRESADGNPH